MKGKQDMKLRIIPLFVAAALAAGSAQAADKTPAPAANAPTAQQQAARDEIDRLVKRIEELSKQLGDDGDVRVIVRKDRMRPGDAPMAPGGMEWEDEDGGKRHIHMERRGPGDGMPPMADWGMSGPGLGVVLAPNTAASGVKIAAVTPDSPASKAGLRTGDVLMQVNGKAISGNGSDAVENARKQIGELKNGQVVKLRYARQGKSYDASVTAAEIQRAMAFRREGPRAWREGGEHEHWKHEDFDHVLPAGVETEIERIGPRGDCDKGKKDCGMPMIYEAFRWRGLNLASVDEGLGRYFGTQKGVLVLSSGDDIKGLQSGDVITKVGGVVVDSPRGVMRALRDKDAGSQLKFDVLRDKRALAVNVTVPEGRPLPWVTPPPPPPPPPPAAPGAPPAPPAAPTPPPPPARSSAMWSSADGSVYVVTIDEDDMNEDDGDNAVLQVAPPVAR
jgi:hypothetical protein